MHDKLLRQIRDRLTAIAALLCALVSAVLIGVAILAYWHIKVDRMRESILEANRPPASSPVTHRVAGPSR